MSQNRVKGWLLLAGAILSESIGSLSLKAALDTPAFYALVAVGFIGAFAFLAAVLRTGMALGIAYGIWGACGVALTAIMSFVLFDEPLSWLMGIGIVVVIAGVLCVEFGSHAADHRAAHSQIAANESAA